MPDPIVPNLEILNQAASEKDEPEQETPYVFETDTVVPDPDVPYTIRRLKSVLGKAGALFVNFGEHFKPVYATLLGEVANEIVPEAATALEAEIKAVEQSANEMIDALRARLISVINAHIHKAAPEAVPVLYPPLSESLNKVSPIAVAPVPAVADQPPQATAPRKDGGK